MLCVSISEVYYTDVNLAKRNNRFAFNTPSCCKDSDTIKKLDDMIEPRKLIDIKLRLKEVNKGRLSFNF